MPNHSKQAIEPYQRLITFVNAQITPDNWRQVLDQLKALPLKGKREEREQRLAPYLRLGGPMPLSLNREQITGPNPLLEVQEELREDLVSLTAATGKNLSWLEDKLNGSPSRSIFVTPRRPHLELRIPMGFQVFPAWDADKVLATDPATLVPAIEDLRVRVYWLLANLWADGLLPRLGRCQNEKCRKFFLGKTSREEQRYCSRRCAQRVTAPARVKASRARRATWTAARENLERAVENMQTLRQTTEKQALEKGANALKKAETVFSVAYPRKKGPGYEEGEKLLARAKEQVKRLRKRVRGY
jgi:hypothetical protein